VADQVIDARAKTGDSPGRNFGNADKTRESEIDHRRLRLRPHRCTIIILTHSSENRMVLFTLAQYT
jgi:hypothetical protein